MSEGERANADYWPLGPWGIMFLVLLAVVLGGQIASGQPVFWPISTGILVACLTALFVMKLRRPNN